jgi:hypothetical protein
MRKLQNKTDVSNLIINSFVVEDDELVGATVRILNKDVIRDGTLVFETDLWFVSCRQKCYGYDENGVYGFPRIGYRLLPVVMPFEHYIGCVKMRVDLEIVSHNKN